MTLDADTWRSLVDEAEPPTRAEVARVLEDDDLLDVAGPYEVVEAAIADGPLVEDPDAGMFGRVLVEDTETTEDERGEVDETPTPHADTSGSKTAVDALDDALEYFYAQVDTTITEHTEHGDHPDRPTTAREYFRGRGWDDDTIDEMRLGWAPASSVGVLDHLMREGHDREAILGTGLFADDLTPLWRGRYVLPYFDGEGEPVYAIARCTGAKGGGAAGYDGHAQDRLAGKYAKLRHTDDRVPFDEPIWGHHTLREGEPVVVAEGIADAITVAEAGYAVLSPVAKEFKREHYDPLLEAVVEFDVPRVTVIPDSERAAFDRVEDATDPDSIREAVSVPATSPGMGGAFRTADHLAGRLSDEPTTVRVAELPLPATTEEYHKVDLDDFVHTWAGDLEAVLASAKPAEAYVGYDAATASVSSDASDQDVSDTAGGGTDTRDPAEYVGSNQSDLWDLDLGDLENLNDGDRTKNPFKHTGDSENYFIVRQQGGGDLIATDYKGDGGSVTYNALTALLVDAGKRPRDHPEGSLSDAEVFYAWRQARKRGDLGDGDPVPYRGLRGVAVADGLVDREDLVARDSDTGEVVVGEEEDRDTYDALPPGTYADVLEHVREEYGLDPGRDAPDRDDDTDQDDHDEEYRPDPREVEATVDPRRAWDAAGRVTPQDLDTDDLPTTADSEAFACPECGDTVDVVRAAAVDSRLVESCDATLEAEYPEAYRRAREAYGAPLPEYYTEADAIAEFDALLDVIAEVDFFDLDTDALNSEITERGDEVGGDAVRALDPAWRDSESGASVLVFDSGTVWDADTERVLDALRFVALDSGLIDNPGEPLQGSAFTEAYRRLREAYGAPVPRWDPATDGSREVTPQLPPSEELVDEVDLTGVAPDALEAAREEVEALLGDATAEADTPTVVTALPATGKTTGAVKIARDRPVSYLAPRKELQHQALEKAQRWGVDARVCPVFSEERVDEEVLAAAVSHVREVGKSRLRDRWAILSAAFDDLEDDEAPDLGDIFEGNDEEEDVALDRPTCETAEGDHGVAWALVVHTARRLGYTPQEIHTQARGLFGAELPCACGGECEYKEGWDHVADADDTADLLVGSYVHGHVESVRTEYTRGPDDRVEKAPRAVVLDEFPGEAFVSGYGEEALDFSTWLAGCLRPDVDDRRDMFDADLYGDGWVRAWLDGSGDEVDSVGEAIDALARVGDLGEARDAAREILDEVEDGLLENLHLDAWLRAVVDVDADPAEAYRDLAVAVDDVPREHPAYGVVRWADEEVREPLGAATLEGGATPDLSAAEADLPIGGDLADLVDSAVEAVRNPADAARERLAAAVTALRGGREGCRRLAAWAEDGYAHPDAHHLLTGVITPTGPDSDVPGACRVGTDAWAFDPDATDGTVVDCVPTTERATAVVDRNDHGALVHTPPSRTAGNGDPAPLVGLDATGRRDLWATALGEDVTLADIHDTPTERAAFLEDALDLRVIQAADRPRPYEGDPTTKDTDGDVALLEALADEYAGLEAPRQRGAEPVRVGTPAVVTTKQVREVLEADPRLDGVVSDWENYGNVKGSNDLSEHQLAAVLGSQHYGDHAIERFCALEGREVDTSRDTGRGAGLDYGDDLANEYLRHMREDQTMQAILRFSRGDSGATVVARTSALREDLPVVGDAQVVETWSDTAAAIARAYRRLGGEFTAADVRDAVDVTPRQVRRVLGELAEAGYIDRVDSGPGVATTYDQAGQPGAGEVDLLERDEAVDATDDPGRSPHNQYYTWNVRVRGGGNRHARSRPAPPGADRRAPPAPTTVDGVDPPG